MKRMRSRLAAMVAFGIAAFASDGQAEDTTPPPKTADVTALHPAPPLALGQRVDSGGQINGRPDWDVDYPSQLAPQALPASHAAAAREDTMGSAPLSTATR